ncbi:deoxyribose-phosphate aldolase [Psychroflexus planctonicus]|uniref:Deoxyribose-phosphate aldolase n=1 Tax=Psychroflexus planctonicus TaxID=1526575 RepID=A0ABQ1SCN5_9FLAO|nr:deoxyribose-phosphate aldolase [Psychroflexus planctonicus]GGE28512.1 deoxyribose-phosphate aldolase [Psychroflexus planctonicus]
MKINKYIDHTLLKAGATIEEIKKLCDEAIQYKFASVCIPSYYVKDAYEILRKTDVKVCTVVGFPLGNSSTETKVREAQIAIEEGAKEIDMVINQAAIKSNRWDDVQSDISQVKVATGNYILKVILETCNLTDEEIARACQEADKAGVDFVKTSTGFASGGATTEAVQIMKDNISKNVKIKASGGIRDLQSVKQYIELGVSRIGASSGVAIMEGTKTDSTY